ncbi:hypothetical protein [Ornithinimicrobium murale]|uniref:hypothetical protein n=1 Tax=Ornithinimicrobium murale TaxID=1050153 RepID=UPI000E0DB900|nr:hypothetical protein [Ornithinimicrobium murale]
MKRILITVTAALSLAASSAGAVATATGPAAPDHAASGPAQESRDDLRTEPTGSMILEKSDCTNSWFKLAGGRFACLMGPYDEDWIAKGVQHGWEAGGANVTGGWISQHCQPYLIVDKWCAVIAAY